MYQNSLVLLIIKEANFQELTDENFDVSWHAFSKNIKKLFNNEDEDAENGGDQEDRF